jgi:hypothetical protein
MLSKYAHYGPRAIVNCLRFLAGAFSYNVTLFCVLKQMLQRNSFHSVPTPRTVQLKKAKKQTTNGKRYRNELTCTFLQVFL